MSAHVQVKGWGYVTLLLALTVLLLAGDVSAQAQGTHSATPSTTPIRTASPTTSYSRTSTSTPVSCDNYVITVSTGATIVPGAVDTGNHCGNCVTLIQLPFPVRLYDQTFTSANVSSNGNMQFFSADPAPASTSYCLPVPFFDYVIMPLWSDLWTYSPFGIYTSISGSAPDRIFNVEWRTGCVVECDLNFEVRLYEGQDRFDIIYGYFNQGRQGENGIIGVQRGTGGSYVQYSCFTPSIHQGLMLTFELSSCASNTPVSTATGTATATNTVIPTMTLNPTTTPTHSPTATVSTPTQTSTPMATCEPLAWQIVPSANPGGGMNQLKAIAAVSANDIWAVGLYGAPPQATLIQHWDGVTWNVVSSPSMSTLNYLFGVDAVSANDVWAVGSYYDTATYMWKTLVEHWDGTSWSVLPSPNLQMNSSLNSVAAVATNNVWAVGHWWPGVGADNQPLILHWDGSQWSIVSTPTLDEPSFLIAVDAISPNDIWAVGAQAEQPLIMHWNGAEWSVVPNPHPGSKRAYLRGVAAISPDDVWAVGFYGSYEEVQALAMHWDGASWSVVPLPDMGELSHLHEVAGTAADNVWAVGAHLYQNREQPLVLHWDGAQWSIAATPQPEAERSLLQGVIAIAPDNVWAVGYLENPEAYQPQQTLIEHYTAASVFTDVPPGSPFYTFIGCLACQGIISGYDDGTFRPNNHVTRGQLSKIVSNAAGFSENPGAQIFEDVAPGHPFYDWINRLARRGHMGGYECGGPAEPCVSGMPYFRPHFNATRGQTSKIVANAAEIHDPASGQTFEDVPPSHPFYQWIERLSGRGVMGGYECGGPGEPCITGRAYFRPHNNVTRGQSAKIVANTFFPNCQTP